MSPKALRDRLTTISILALLAAALALPAAACGGGGGDNSDQESATPSPGGDIVPVVASSDLTLGLNRFMVGLIDQAQNAEVLDGDLHFRFFKLENGGLTFKVELDATPVRITKTYTHTHQDGTIESHEAGESGVYVVNVAFDNPGDWKVEVSGTAAGKPLGPLTAPFLVSEQPSTVPVGQPAPRSVQPILKDVAAITDIDTSDPPNPDMHNLTIADAVSSGKPSVIVFATPAFCVSRICGPTKEVVDDLYDKYKGQANFVHIEPYDLAKARSGEGLEPLPFVTDEWGLQTEPWVFLVDSQGIITAKFEAVVSFEELESALLPLLAAVNRYPHNG